MRYPAPFLAALSLLLLLAALWDARKRRIPNWLNASLAGLGFAAHVLLHDWLTTLAGLAAGVVTVALLWTPWMKGLLGGGDVKVAAAAAVWVTLSLYVEYVLYAALAGGLVAVACFFLSSASARSEMRANMLVAVLVRGMPDAPIRGGTGRVSVPYGAGVAIAAMALLWTKALG
jgi:prepilin peptidase CpaA